MIPILALTASAAPLESPRPSLWEAARKGVTWFFTNLSPAFLLAILGILVCGAFSAITGTACAPAPAAWSGLPWRRNRPNPAA